MGLTTNEAMLIEALTSMLDQDAKLGLSIHDVGKETERGSEYYHNHIGNLFWHKTADLVHANGVTASFTKVHSYKYVDDPTFPTAMEKEMVAMAIPEKERAKAQHALTAIVAEVKTDMGVEKDAGNHPDFKEIKAISRPEQNTKFKIEREIKPNIKWEKGTASPSRPD